MRRRITEPGKSLLESLIGGLGTALFLLLAIGSSAWAHGVYIYAWADGGIVHTESYFGAKRKVQDGLIRVYDPKGKLLLDGRTNEQGEFSFPSPGKMDLRIVVEAGSGHKNECVLKAEEQTGSVDSKTEPVAVPSVGPQEESSAPATVDTQQLQSVLEKALDSRLAPIRRELAAIRNEKSPGLTEIIGGIGYLLGIMGLVMYFKSRRN